MSLQEQQPTLAIKTEHGPSVCVVRIQGELDLAGCAELEQALSEAEQTPARCIILDLDKLTFIDSSGLASLIRATRRSESNGNRLEMTQGSGQPADMFHLTMLDRRLPITPRAG